MSSCFLCLHSISLIASFFFVASWFLHLCLVSPALHCSQLCSSMCSACIKSPSFPWFFSGPLHLLLHCVFKPRWSWWIQVCPMFLLFLILSFFLFCAAWPCCVVKSAVLLFVSCQKYKERHSGLKKTVYALLLWKKGFIIRVDSINLKASGLRSTLVSWILFPVYAFFFYKSCFLW